MAGEFYIICYDSPSNKRRNKLHKLLKNYAVPVQKSVFETFLDKSSFNKMMKKIEALMNPDEDSVRIYGMNKQIQKQVKIIGSPGILEDPNYFFINEGNETENQIIGKVVEIEDDGNLPDWL